MCQKIPSFRHSYTVKAMAQLGAGESEGIDESLWEQLNAGRDVGGVIGGGIAQ